MDIDDFLEARHRTMRGVADRFREQLARLDFEPQFIVYFRAGTGAGIDFAECRLEMIEWTKLNMKHKWMFDIMNYAVFEDKADAVLWKLRYN